VIDLNGGMWRLPDRAGDHRLRSRGAARAACVRRVPGAGRSRATPAPCVCTGPVGTEH